MKKNTIILLSIVIATLLSCVKDSDYTAPEITCNEPQLTATNTISQLKEMYKFGGPTVIDTDVIIEGYVVSSDESGNIFKTLSIQDKPENPTAGIKIAIDETNLYATYAIGQKIYVKLKGLAIGYSFGSFQIGKASGAELARISAYEIKNHIIRSCEIATVVPKKITVNQLNETLVDMLIEIENAQFSVMDLQNSFANINNVETVNRSIEIFDNNCQFLGETFLRNSGYANFKNEIVPQGKGSVIAVVGNYYADMQLYIRSTSDITFTQERCNYSNAFAPTISLSEVRNLFNGNLFEFGVTNNYIVEGYINATDEFGNFENRIVLQDKPENPTAGIQILIDDEAIYENFNLGDKVFVKLNKLYLGNYNGVLTIGYPKGNTVTEIETDKIGSFIFNTNENYTLKPTVYSIDQLAQSAPENTLVSVTNVQLSANEIGAAFAYFSGTSNGFRTLETCNIPSKLAVFTNGKATFANTQFPTGNGTATGIYAGNLEIRNENDINFNQPYAVCPVIVPKILITEVADPKNNVSARFVELYNAGENTIDLSGWKLNKYINGAVTISASPVSLNGVTIAPGEFVIIANSEYEAVFADVPNIVSSYISGNGDDVYELTDNNGNTNDIFGVIGEDGNGTAWEYLDGKATRNVDIAQPNSVFTPLEWTIYADTANNLITFPNTPQVAPTDYNPRVR